MENFSTEVLLQRLANAKTTAAMALGHTKSRMNDGLVKQYEQELRSRKVKIPDSNVLYDKGIFNGEGSF